MCQFGKQPWWLELACTSPSKLPPQWLPLTCTTSSQQPGDGCPASEGEGSSCTAWLCCQPFLRSHYPSSFLLMAFWLRSLDRDHTQVLKVPSLLSRQVHNLPKQPFLFLQKCIFLWSSVFLQMGFYFRTPPLFLSDLEYSTFLLADQIPQRKSVVLSPQVLAA